MDLKGEVTELIKEVQSCAEGLDEWPLQNYSDGDRDQLARARDALREVLQRVGSM